jgi:phage shock protein PspC (stress-responsive transcriptional regulator)
MDTTHTTEAEPLHDRLERPEQDRVLGGVAVAIANRSGTSVGWVRLAFLVASLLGGLGIVVYLAAWALIPAAGTTMSAAEQWMNNLTTPGKRVGAFLIGIDGLIVIAGAAPLTITAVAILLAGAALLAEAGPAAETGVETATAESE